MNYMFAKLYHFLYRKLYGYDKEEYLIILTVCSIFLPFPCFLTVLAFVLIYVISKVKISFLIQMFPKSKYVFISSIISLITCLFYKNYLGLLCTFGIISIFIFILFYRYKINKRLFELLIDSSCLASLFCFLYALLEYYRIVHSLNYSFFRFIVLDDPQYRVNSTFFNANYYGMIIEFIVLMCVYKMMQAKTLRRFVFYIIIILCNFSALYLSGCRSAWATFLITVPLMFFCNRNWKLFYSTITIELLGLSVFLVDPTLFPRIESLALYFNGRVKIWEVALQGIQHQPLVGYGPLAYMHIYPSLNGPITQHSHSLYLDPILSFGIIGASLNFIYLWDNLKEIYELYKRKYDICLFSLILGCILSVMIHGILDYTIFWVQTAPLFFIVFSASSIFHKSKSPISIEKS